MKKFFSEALESQASWIPDLRLLIPPEEEEKRGGQKTRKEEKVGGGSQNWNLRNVFFEFYVECREKKKRKERKEKKRKEKKRKKKEEKEEKKDSKGRQRQKKTKYRNVYPSTAAAANLRSRRTRLLNEWKLISRLVEHYSYDDVMFYFDESYDSWPSYRYQQTNNTDIRAIANEGANAICHIEQRTYKNLKFFELETRTKQASTLSFGNQRFETEAQGLSFVFPISKATISVDIPDDGFRAVNWITSALIQFYACDRRGGYSIKSVTCLLPKFPHAEYELNFIDASIIIYVIQSFWYNIETISNSLSVRNSVRYEKKVKEENNPFTNNWQYYLALYAIERDDNEGIDYLRPGRFSNNNQYSELVEKLEHFVLLQMTSLTQKSGNQ
ncbi:hypothetical protein V1478_003145 [Vespula squamosa]|uniref:Uncharacterized protein n=1 Tax=Vespula squamosa TaxID=30214 RepID=A0ABD2BSD5_VESSQ